MVAQARSTSTPTGCVPWYDRRILISDPSPEPVAVHEPARRGGSIVLVLLVAGAHRRGGGRADDARPHPGAALYPRPAGAARDGRAVQPVRLCRRHHPLRRPHGRRSGDGPHRRSRLRRPGGDRPARPRGLFQCRLSGADGRGERAGRAPGRARLHRQSRRLGGGVPPAQGGARRQAAAGRSPHRRQRRRAWPLAAHAGASARRRASARRNTRCGRSPTSRATASARRTCSRNCSTRSNISIMRLAASSRSIPPATSSMSTRRSRTGSITISPRSARAG